MEQDRRGAIPKGACKKPEGSNTKVLWMILDTSILIDILDGNDRVIKSLQQLKENACTTTISKYELLKAPKDDQVENMLAEMEIYSFDDPAPARSAHIFKALKRKGRMINELDILIAAIAIARDELLVTRDGDFKKVEGLKLLLL
jgi:predicted nucleic acid-binding protein